jgi:hypothetical protein
VGNGGGGEESELDVGLNEDSDEEESDGEVKDAANPWASRVISRLFNAAHIS